MGGELDFKEKEGTDTASIGVGNLQKKPFYGLGKRRNLRCRGRGSKQKNETRTFIRKALRSVNSECGHLDMEKRKVSACASVHSQEK